MQRKQEGANIKAVKQQNKMLVVKYIATNTAVTRVDLAKATGLSKMAIGNLVSELMSQNIIEESPCTPIGNLPSGRPPVILRISKNSPKICGMLIKRGFCQVIIADIRGKIIKSKATCYNTSEVTVPYLIDTLIHLYHDISADLQGNIIAVGISSLGPLNTKTGEILNPPDFYGISNLNIVRIISEKTRLPTYLINDANAGALAEKLYGIGKQSHSFIYLHIMNGIGAGLVLNDKLYNGDFGQSGEIGHSSISFCGPKCSCGNTGCLDLYANLINMKKKCCQLSSLYSSSPLAKNMDPSWTDFIDYADAGDDLAIAVLDGFCEYISYALINVLNILDVSRVIVGYDSNKPTHIIEDILSCKISSAVLYSKYRETKFIHSSFAGNAPLVGSIAVVADKIFDQVVEI